MALFFLHVSMSWQRNCDLCLLCVTAMATIEYHWIENARVSVARPTATEGLRRQWNFKDSRSGETVKLEVHEQATKRAVPGDLLLRNYQLLFSCRGSVQCAYTCLHTRINQSIKLAQRTGALAFVKMLIEPRSRACAPVYVRGKHVCARQPRQILPVPSKISKEACIKLDGRE